MWPIHDDFTKHATHRSERWLNKHKIPACDSQDYLLLLCRVWWRKTTTLKQCFFLLLLSNVSSNIECNQFAQYNSQYSSVHYFMCLNRFSNMRTLTKSIPYLTLSDNHTHSSYFEFWGVRISVALFFYTFFFHSFIRHLFLQSWIFERTQPERISFIHNFIVVDLLFNICILFLTINYLITMLLCHSNLIETQRWNQVTTWIIFFSCDLLLSTKMQNKW